MRVIPMRNNLDEILLDGALTLTLPSGIPMPLDRAFRVVDNTGVGGSTITVTGPINATTSDTLTAAYQTKTYIWVGDKYVVDA
jgi:hypothetical protein